MAETRQQSPKLAVDLLIIGVGVALELLASHFGVRAGLGVQRGLGTVWGGISLIYLGTLFLLSYFFPDSSYILNFLRYVCEECSRGGRGRHMALLFFAGGVVRWLAFALRFGSLLRHERGANEQIA